MIFIDLLLKMVKLAQDANLASTICPHSDHPQTDSEKVTLLSLSFLVLLSVLLKFLAHFCKLCSWGWAAPSLFDKTNLFFLSVQWKKESSSSSFFIPGPYTLLCTRLPISLELSFWVMKSSQRMNTHLTKSMHKS